MIVLQINKSQNNISSVKHLVIVIIGWNKTRIDIGFSLDFSI